MEDARHHQGYSGNGATDFEHATKKLELIGWMAEAAVNEYPVSDLYEALAHAA